MMKTFPTRVRRNNEISDTNSERSLLRHLLATIAYRCGIAIADAPPNFTKFRAGESSRTAGEILAHIGDLIEGTLCLLKGEFVYLQSAPQTWNEDAARFLSTVKKLDLFLASENALAQPIEKIMQGPLADALTHVGQIVMLRRLAGQPVKETTYFTADIIAGEIDEKHFDG